MRTLDVLAAILVVVGAANWGLVGLFQFDLVAAIFGDGTMLSRMVYSFEIQPADGDGERCTLIQTARFKPKGLVGLAYWYAVVPLHGIVFKGMLRGIRRTAVLAAHAPSDAGSGSLPCVH